MDAQFFVYRGDFLLYRQIGVPSWAPYGVVAGDALDGWYDPKCGVVSPLERDLRPATLEDFRTFRISPLPHRVKADGTAIWSPEYGSRSAA